MSKPFAANLEEKTTTDTIVLDIVRKKGESWGIELCGEGPTEIRKVRPGGPADHAGLQPGDIILMCNGINTTRFGHQQVASIIAETERLLRMKILPDEDESSDEEEEGEEGEDKFKSEFGSNRRGKGTGEWWCDPEADKRAKEEAEAKKVDPTDFESFSENFDKIEKQHRKAGKKMTQAGSGRKPRKDIASDDDSDDEYARFAKMKQKMIDKGKISGSESDDDGNDEFAEFMRWKQQKRKAQRRGIDDWDQDNWTEAPQRPVNRSSSGYSSASSGPNRQNAVQGRDVGFRGQKIEQGTFIINHSDVQKFDRTFELGAENTFKGDKAAIAGAFTGDHNVEFHDDGQAGGDVKGVRNRVAAGIMHFNYEDEQKEVPEEDKDKVVIYTTSLGVNRELVAGGQRAIAIIRSYKVKYEERDIFNFEQHKDGLWDRLGLDRGDKFPPMPRIYIDGIYIGGINELEVMSDCGDLRIRLQNFSKFQDRRHCQYCLGTGLLICRKCNGKRVIQMNDCTELQCSVCDKEGHIPCLDCTESGDLF